MKKLLLSLLAVLVLAVNPALAAPFEFQPYQITQPNGEQIDCFVSGDEYFNWLHDADGFTIIQAADGYFYYGITEKGEVVPSAYQVNSVNPEEAGLEKWAKISKEAYQRIKDERSSVAGQNPTRAPHLGTMNNIVVYIKFSDDTEFTTIRQTYDDLFNLPTGNSLKSYYTEVSYNQFTIGSTHYPACAMTTNYSYTDTHTRSYFEPYNATTNPNGYNGDTERRLREHALLRDAVNWINANSPVPGSLNIDGDNDNNVDNVCFIVRGGNGAWASLLWAHRWVLYSYNVYINGKRVWDYTFQPESQVNVKTLCHEMFHALGAPDLYHYNDGGLNIDPVGQWDLMESGGGHMGAYMKWKYSDNSWIASIPEITTSGTYTLNPLASATNNCYKIASPNSTSQYFVVEYRQKTGTFEGSLPASGLIVYRIDPAYNGNADGPPDEVYIYRPNGTTTVNGQINNGYFSLQSGITSINDGTNPSSFLQNGNAGGLNIYNVTSAGSTISFTVGISTVSNPAQFTATGVSENQIDLQWQKNGANDNVILSWSATPNFGNPVSGTSYPAGSTIPGGGEVLYTGNGTSFSHSNLTSSTTYYYKLWSVDSTTNYSNGISANATTLCGQITFPYTANFAGSELSACWTQQVAGTNVAQSWTVSASNYAGGAANEMMSTYQNRNPGTTRLVLPVMNTTGIAQLSLSFRHMLDDYGAGATLRIQSSSNGTDWTNEAWSLATAGNTNVGPAIVNTTISANLNQPTTWVAFTVTGNLYQYDYWYIDDVTVNVAAYLSYEITTASNPVAGGNTSGGGTYNYGSQASVTAIPATGYEFTAWSENGSQVSSDNPYIFSVNSARLLTAGFALQQFNVVTNSSPADGGNTTGGGTFTYGSQATVGAVPVAGYDFLNWKENGNIVSTSPEYSFNVENNRNLTAHFVLQQFSVSLYASPLAGGTVSGGGSYNYGTTALVNAEATAGWNFENWTENGNVVSNSAQYSFVVSQSRNLTANFTQQILQYDITATPSPAEGGSTTGSGIYNSGETVNLEATPNSGWHFVNWTENGNVVSTNASYSFIATSNHNLTAAFAEDILQFNIIVSAAPAEGGQADGGGTFQAGTNITVVATANPDWVFKQWIENGQVVSEEEEYTFTVSSDRNLIAEFIQIFQVSLGLSPVNGGTISGDGFYPEGTLVTVVAEAAPDFAFTQWTENGNSVSTNPVYSFEISGNRALTAEFRLTVSSKLKDISTLKVSPNPSTGIFIVELNGLPASVPGKVKVYNITGMELINREFQNGNEKLILDLTGFSDGLYFLTIIINENKIFTSRLIVK